MIEATDQKNEKVITPADLKKETFFKFETDGVLKLAVKFSDYEDAHQINYTLRNNVLFIIHETSDTTEHEIIELNDTILILKLLDDPVPIIMKFEKTSSTR